MASPLTNASSEESRAFLQARAGRYSLIIGSIGLVFWAVRAVGQLAQGNVAHLLEPNMYLHLLGTVPMFGVWLFNRRGEPSSMAIHASEQIGLVLACLLYGFMGLEMTQAFRPDITVLLIFMLLSLTRAIYVPSSWQYTAFLGVLLGVELGVVIWFAFETIDPAFAAAFELEDFDVAGDLRFQLVFNVLTWWIAMSVIATSASAVIYGLRRDLRKVKQLGQYTLIRKLGEGGMGVVYEAKHAMLRRPTAVKLLLPQRVDERDIARFEREVRATAALEHPNTITVFDFGRTPDGIFYYAMELIEGATLADLVALEGPLPPARVVFLLHQVAGALAEAHESGLVHRDIKPDNVLISRSGWMADHAKVVDFGLVKEIEEASAELTADHQIVGTPRYLAPEAIRGDGALDARSDLYAFGCVAYFLLTGGHLFDGGSVVEIASQHLRDVPPPLAARGAEVSDALEALVQRCLAKDPADRPASASELRGELEATPEMGGWTTADAERWWATHGDRLRAAAQQGALESARTGALTIEIADR